MKNIMISQPREETVNNILGKEHFSLGKKISALRNVHYFSRRRFAQIIGISEQELFLYEHDVMKPSTMVLHRMAAFFGTTIWKF